MDPITKTMDKKPIKNFMVNQLKMAFEKNKMILSPFDELLHKQLIDYEVVRIAQNGTEVYSSENEHFVDAFGLAYLAFVLEFVELTNSIKEVKNSSKILHSNKTLGENRLNAAFREATFNSGIKKVLEKDPDEIDRQKWVQVDSGYRSKSNVVSWGNRSPRNNKGFSRSMW